MKYERVKSKKRTKKSCPYVTPETYLLFTNTNKIVQN